MQEHYTAPERQFAPDVNWSCNGCAANGRLATGVGPESLEMHMNEHLVSQIQDRVQLVVDLQVPRQRPAPGPALVDVAARSDGTWDVLPCVPTSVRRAALPIARCWREENAEYLAELWNRDHSD